MTSLRIDDLGSSSKRWERHRGKWFPYREMLFDDLWDLHLWLRSTRSHATLAITACWVERDGALVPYARKWPMAAEGVRSLVAAGLVEIACHGLTHCIPGRHVPSWAPWRGNRPMHREFIAALPFAAQVEHLRRAKALLEDTFGVAVSTLVPPGNAISERLALTALDMGFERVTCRQPAGALWTWILDDTEQTVLHDRDLVTEPDALARVRHRAPFCTVREWASAQRESATCLPVWP
jgi:peptidoglycan/xylan/chitin deacetylase (PgdA/CDA1 family)